MNLLNPLKSRRRHREILQQTPFHRLVASLLETASITYKADAIVIGFRPDLPLEEQLLPDNPSEIAAAQARIATPPSPSEREAIENRAQLRGPTRTSQLPVCFLTQGQFLHYNALPIHSYGYFLTALHESIVSRDPTTPARFIQLPPTSSPRFIEIDLEWSSTNLLWIHLRALHPAR